MVGGGYGRKLETEAIEQAAILAVRLDRPVQLTWPRIQEIQRDTMRPPAAARMSAWVEARRIASWQALIAAPATSSEVARRLHAADSFFRPDGGATAGAVPPYAIANVAVDHAPVELGLATGIWRSGAHSYTCFFTECFVDELARAAGIEPLSFRIRMLAQNPRLARVLATATAIGGWDGGPPGSGMGIAAHSAFGSHVATLVEIEMSREQRIRVLRAVCAVDCGRIVNPGIVRQQIEGGIIHGISAAIGDPIVIANGTPTARSIGAYRLPTLRDAPEVTVELIESEDDPGGVTELSVPTAAPAVANAFFSLTGQRQRRLPLIVGAGGADHDPPSRRAARQSRHAGRARAGRGAALSRGIPVRSARRRDSAFALAADPARHHPHDPAPQVRPRLPPGLDRGGIAARRDHRRPGEGAGRGFGDRVVVDHAMRYGRPAIADRIEALKAGGLRPDPGRAALSAILRRHDRDRQ